MLFVPKHQLGFLVIFKNLLELSLNQNKEEEEEEEEEEIYFSKQS